MDVADRSCPRSRIWRIGCVALQERYGHFSLVLVCIYVDTIHPFDALFLQDVKCPLTDDRHIAKHEDNGDDFKANASSHSVTEANHRPRTSTLLRLSTVLESPLKAFAEQMTSPILDRAEEIPIWLSRMCRTRRAKATRWYQRQAIINFIGFENVESSGSLNCRKTPCHFECSMAVIISFVLAALLSSQRLSFGQSFVLLMPLVPGLLNPMELVLAMRGFSAPYDPQITSVAHDGGPGGFRSARSTLKAMNGLVAESRVADQDSATKTRSRHLVSVGNCHSCRGDVR